MSVVILQAGCQDAGRISSEPSAVCETPSPANVVLPPQTELWAIAWDQQWVIYTESMDNPAATSRKRYWLAKIRCRSPVNATVLLDATTPFDDVYGFASDSSAVLFQADTPDYIDQLWVLPLPGVQDKRKIYTADMFRSLEWAPDGRHVVIIPGDQGADLVGVDGSVKRIIPGDTFNRKGGGVISWSPSGDQVAYINDVADNEPARLWIVDTRSGERRQMYSIPGAGLPNPDWSPDGQTIAVYDFASFGPVALISPSGGVRAIVHLRGAVESEKWSPDGKHLAVMYTEGSGDDRKHYLGVITVANGQVDETLLDRNWGIDDWLDSNTIDSWTPDSRDVVLKVSQFKGGNWVDVLVHIPVR